MTTCGKVSGNKRDKMMSKTYSCIRIIIVLAPLFALSGCYLLRPPPYQVAGSVELDADGVPRFTYMPCISDEWELRGMKYYLRGVRVSKPSGKRCPASETHCAGPVKVWEISNEAWSQKPEPAPGMVSLPNSIRYGEAVPGMRVDVPAKRLETNIEYAVEVTVTAIDPGRIRKGTVAVVYFTLTGNESTPQLSLEGACPIK